MDHSFKTYLTFIKDTFLNLTWNHNTYIPGIPTLIPTNMIRPVGINVQLLSYTTS